MISLELHCDSCGWWTLSGAADTSRRLRALGMFRRVADPAEEMIREILEVHQGRLLCDRCRSPGLRICDSGRGDEGEWFQVRLCELCRTPIPAERLEALPSAVRCTACQDAADRGASMVEPDFCPKCGALVEIRMSGGRGLTRYKMFCTGSPPCRL